MFAWFLLLFFLYNKLWCHWLLLIESFFLMTTFSHPSFFVWRGVGGDILGKEVSMLLCLLFHQILILILIYLLRTLLVGLTHFLLHYLREYTVTAGRHEQSLRFDLSFWFFFAGAYDELRNVWLRKNTLWVWLPLYSVQFWILKTVIA